MPEHRRIFSFTCRDELVSVLEDQRNRSAFICDALEAYGGGVQDTAREVVELRQELRSLHRLVETMASTSATTTRSKAPRPSRQPKREPAAGTPPATSTADLVAWGVWIKGLPRELQAAAADFAHGDCTEIARDLARLALDRRHREPKTA